jgi:predicted PurR-regulated permease PerM
MDQDRQFADAVVGFPLAIALLVFVGLTLLLPVFVAMISSRIGKLLQEVKAQTQATKQLQESVAHNTSLIKSHGTEVADQLDTSNILTRQLLRAYGHEPEA